MLVPILRQQDVPIVWLNWGVRPDLLNISPSLLHAHTQDGSGAGLGETIPGGAPILRKGGWGAQIVDELDPGGRYIHVTKHRFSGFCEDCVATTSPEYCMQATVYNVKLLFAFMTTSAALIAGLQA
jgi:nicotinamidase-related amidase